MTKRTEILLIVLLILVGVFLFLYKLPWVSGTNDEKVCYLKTGKYLLKNFRWDTDCTIGHPPLTFYWHGLPSLFFTGEAEQELLYARLTMLPVFIAFAVCMFIVSKRFFGLWSGFLALILFIFNPEILSHVRLITVDFFLAFFIFLFCIFFYAFIKKPGWKYFFLTAFVLGLNLLTKHTALILLPLMPVGAGLAVWFNKSDWKKLAAGMSGILFIAFFMLHAGYLFKESAKFPDSISSGRLNKIAALPNGKTILTVLFPRAYLIGLDYQFQSSEDEAWRAFIAGEYYEGHRWYFLPLSFLIKTPVPLLILIFGSILFIIFKKFNGKPLLNLYLLIIIVWFWINLAVFNHRDLGLRYLLMIYPLIFVLIGEIGGIREIGKIGKGVITVLLVWYIAGTIAVAPHYLAFANETIGGPQNAWKYFADSNLDWGQEDRYFEEYWREHPELVVEPVTPTTGKIAVYASSLNMFHYHEYQWLRKLNKEPIEEIGFVWLIFDIKPEELK